MIMALVKKRRFAYFLIFLFVCDTLPTTASTQAYAGSKVPRKEKTGSNPEHKSNVLSPQTSKDNFGSKGPSTLPAGDTSSPLVRNVLEGKFSFSMSSEPVLTDLNMGGKRPPGDGNETDEATGPGNDLNSHSMENFFNEQIYAVMKILQKTSSSSGDTSALSGYGIQGRLSPFIPQQVLYDNASAVPEEPPSFTHIDTNDLTGCLQKRTSINFTVSKGILSMDARNISADITSCCNFLCVVNLKVARDKRLRIEFNYIDPELCDNNNLRIFEWSQSAHTNLITPCAQQTLSNIVNSQFTKVAYSGIGATVAIEISLNQFHKHISFRVVFASVSEAETPTLVGAYTSQSAGYVQTPGFDGISKRVLGMDSWLEIDVPMDHIVMISFVHIDLPPVSVESNLGAIGVYTGSLSECDRQQYIDTKFRPDPEVYDTRALFVHFYTNQIPYDTRGFQMLFSIHNSSARPEKLSEGKWNCSVSFWSDFRQHFPCNLHGDCADGRDEEDCPYTSTSCGPERLSIGSRCYLFLPPRNATDRLSWTEAHTKCQLHGGRLASLSSPDTWRNVEAVLKFREYSSVFIGLKLASGGLPDIYRRSLQHLDGTIAYFVGDLCKTKRSLKKSACLSLETVSTEHLGKHCQKQKRASVLCEILQDTSSERRPANEHMEIPLSRPSPEWNLLKNETYIKCFAGHLTHTFLACDEQSACWTNQMTSSHTSCPAPVSPQPPIFLCGNGQQGISYMMVCDHLADCPDESDEEFCVFQPCLVTQFQCDNHQCVSLNSQCDQINHCRDASDERQCDIQGYYIQIDEVYPPAVVDFDRFGSFILRPMDKDQNGEFPPCPETHFRCPGNGYCLPVFVICNGVYDCPGHEDEAGCENYDCPGLYRCRSSRVCLHPAYVCDNEYHCPQRDDELSCNATCPQYCTCYGLSFFCHNTLVADQYPDLRYLDASSSNIDLNDLLNNTMLVYLRLAHCGLTELIAVSLFNLNTLDLSDNLIQNIEAHFFHNLYNLRELTLSGNPLTRVSRLQHWSLPSLQTLHLVQIHMPSACLDVLKMFPNIQKLNLSDNSVEQLQGDEFQKLKHLQVLDLRGNPLTLFPINTFMGLESLNTVFGDNYKLCCPTLLPSRFNLANCKAPSDEISGCEEMLRSSIYRGFLSLFAFLSVAGNLVSFIYRAIIGHSKNKTGFGIFVANLCVSDFLMGIYLSIIGVADLMYRGKYLSKDVTWRYSATCKAAGFLSFLSNEVSVFIISLITFDRFLVLRFPFSRLHFTKRRALIASACAWLAGIIMAMIPLLPLTSHWHFYSQSGICIPLPVTRKDYPGNFYFLAIMIIFNFVLFLVIVFGQLLIYWSVRKNSMRSSNSMSSVRDINIAQRLIAVAVSDFLCWFPVGLIGLLAMYDYPISGEVSVAIAIFVLPVNSAINPFLYTINVILENRRKQREERLRQMLSNQLEHESCSTNTTEHQDLNSEQALQVLKQLLSRNILSPEMISRFLVDEETTPVNFTNDQSFLLFKQLLAKNILKQEQAFEYITADQSVVTTSTCKL